MSARCRAEYSSSIASWIIVSSRWVAGLSIGMRAFSASSTIVKATAVNARLGLKLKAWVARRSEISGKAVVIEISDATKITMSSAGSARNPTIISRRAPRVPNGVPISMAASEMKTRGREQAHERDRVRRGCERQARAHRRNDRRGRHHRPEHDVGRETEQRGSAGGDDRILVKQLANPAIDLQHARCAAVLQPGAALIDPAEVERRGQERGRDLEYLREQLDRPHSTSANSTISVTK